MVHQWTRMGQFIFLSQQCSASVSLAWPFPSEGIVLWPLALSSGAEVFNNHQRISFRWILITSIKVIDQWQPGVLTAPLPLSIIQIQHPPCLLPHCLSLANLVKVIFCCGYKEQTCFFLIDIIDPTFWIPVMIEIPGHYFLWQPIE